MLTTLFKCVWMYIHVHLSQFSTVISEPDDVTECEGRSTTFTCVLNGSISSDNVQWYRLLKDTGTTETLNILLEDVTVVPLPGADSFTTILYISNAKKSHTGYYWVRSPLGDFCNVSFTVGTGTVLMFKVHHYVVQKLN